MTAVAENTAHYTRWWPDRVAATRIGAVNNPLIPIYREREIGFMVELAASKVLVVLKGFRGYDYRAMVERLRPRWSTMEHVLVVGDGAQQAATCRRGGQGIAVLFEAA